MKIIDFLKYRRNRRQLNSRRSLVVWYGYHSCMIILVVINSIFLIRNSTNLEINIDNNGIFLTFVGFLFAFAGINIYSIFNTNIEEEKRRLSDLMDIYDEEIISTAPRLFFAGKLVKHLQLSLFICFSQKYNSQICNYLWEFNNLTDYLNKKLNSMYSYLCDDKLLYNNDDKLLYNNISLDDNYKKELDEIRGDFIDNCRNACYLFVNFQMRIDRNSDEYFGSLDVESKDKELVFIRETITKLKDLELKEYKKVDFTDSPSEKTPLTTCDILKKIKTDFMSLGKDFKFLFIKRS